MLSFELIYLDIKSAKQSFLNTHFVYVQLNIHVNKVYS